MSEHDSVPTTDPAHERPPGTDDATVAAVGKLSEAWEWIERARGHLYDFHQMMGHADLTVGEAADELEAAGHAHHAELLRREIIGRNVLEGRWTFQVVEEYDDDYYSPVREVEARVRGDLMGGKRHVFEAEMKEQRRTHGKPGHEPAP